MPLTHFACPPSAPTYGEMHTPEYCITECQNQCVSPFLLAALTASNRKNHHKGNYLSATALDGCVRKLTLERTVDFADEPGKQLYSFRGTITHAVVEEAAELRLFDGKSLADLGYLSEWRMAIGFCFKHAAFQLEADIDPADSSTWSKIQCPYCVKARTPKKDRHFVVLGGTLDGLIPIWDGFVPAEGDEVGPEGEGILVVDLFDLKTCQPYAITQVVCGDADAKLHALTTDTGVGHVRDSYVRQANVYRYLGERSRPPKELWDKGVRRLKFRESRLQYFSMGDFPYTGSTYRYRKHWKHEYSNWDIPNVRFFEDKWVEEYIKERGWPIYQSLITGNERGDVCGEDDQWLCDGYCPFHLTELCPNPKVERKALKEGKTKDEAFAIALQTLEEK